MHEVVKKILIDNRWREGEFARYKRIPNQVDEKVWCRMCIPMIYAHWEGFIVDSMRTLLRYLNTLELSSSSIPTNLLVLSLGKAYQPLSGKQSFGQRITFTETFTQKLSSKVSFKLRIETKSNLNSNVLQNICNQMKFDYSEFSDVTQDINRLVNLRNSIAHGENAAFPNLEKIIELIIIVQKAIDIFLDEINLFLTTKKYLLSSSIE